MLISFFSTVPITSIGDQERNMIFYHGWLVDGDGFLSRLWYYIERDLNTSNKQVADRVVKLIQSYVTLAYLRQYELFLFLGLVNALGAQASSVATDRIIEQHKNETRDNLARIIGGRPDESNHLVYGRLLIKPVEGVNFIHYYHKSVGGQGFEGRLVRFVNKHFRTYLFAANDFGSDHNRPRQQIFSGYWNTIRYKDVSTLFMFFQQMNNKNEIFSCDVGGYLYAGDDKYNKDRRHVLAWKGGHHVEGGEWGIGDDGRLRSVLYNEYMYTADLNKFQYEEGLTHYTFTWIPGNQVLEGYYEVHNVIQFG